MIRRLILSTVFGIQAWLGIAQQTNNASRQNKATVMKTGTATQLAPGTWKGTVTINPQLHVNIAIEVLLNNGDFRYFFHSIDQNSYNFPIRKVSFEEDTINLAITSLNAILRLHVNGDTATGYISQRGGGMPTRLEKTSVPLPKPNRPQEPQYPLPYVESFVTVETDLPDVRLAGTLTIPKGNKQYPAVLLIPGSGPSDRDQSIFGHKNMMVLADFLTRNGFVVLRMDDRGTGESTGNFEAAAIPDFAADAAACIRYLAGRPEVAGKQVGVIGHSLGAEIAAYLAATASQVHFVVFMAGSAETLGTTIIRQTEKIYTDRGASAKAVALNTVILNTVFGIIQTTPGDSLALARIDSACIPLNTQLAAIPESERQLIETAYPLTANAFQHLLTPGLRHDLFYDPGTTLKRIKQPALVLQGQNDIQVFPDNGPAMFALLQGKNMSPLSGYKSFPQTNHMFQRCNTCTVDEYQQLEETIAQEVLDTLLKWLTKVVQQ